MKFPEYISIVEQLPYELRLAFIAFCVERCLKEARRHPNAKQQLEKLPLLQEGLEGLWARAEGGPVASPERTRAILDHLSTYETPADEENLAYNYDVTLVDGARILKRGLRMVLDPAAATPRSVAGALEGPVQTVGGVYADYNSARRAEEGVIDAAVLKLKALNDKPLNRSMFDDIPDWPRGQLSKRYAENRLKGTAEEDD